MSKNVKVSNPMKVITGPDTRWSYANVWEAKSINGGTPKFSVSLIIPKSDTATVAKIKATTPNTTPNNAPAKNVKIKPSPTVIKDIIP